MTFDELVIDLKNIKSQEVRAQEENYFEAVIERAQIEALGKSLQLFFGEPIKPANQIASIWAQWKAREFGGVRPEQTMYAQKDESGEKVFAFLWPWSGGDPITLKLIRK